MESKRLLIVVVAAALAMNCYSPVLSAQIRTNTAKQADEEARAENAATVLTEIMETPGHGIPDTLLQKAYGIAVIPHVVNGELGGSGKGLAAQRKVDGTWGTALFVQIGGESLGQQIGVEATDVVLIFTKLDGMQPLIKGKLEIGADNAAAAGPVGRKPEHAGTDVALNSSIYAYSRSKGLFAGFALNGAFIQLDGDANNHTGTAGASVQSFLQTLERYASAKAPQTTVKQ